MLEISQKLGGSRQIPFIYPWYLLNCGYVLWSKIAKLYSEKVSTEHPQKMHLWMDTFTSIVLLNVETVLLALINVLKNLLGHKNKPKPPLSWSDRGPTGDSNKKRVP